MYKDEEDQFKFLKQYLTLQSSELFFANKVVFIEGTTERILLPYFIKGFDSSNQGKESPLSSQNITILEVGANAKVFHKFIDFLEIKSLIITDFDTTKQVEGKKRTNYLTCKVTEGQYTSNATLEHFLKSPGIKDKKIPSDWFDKLKSGKLSCDSKNIKVAYQLEESGYHARSFEDAFLRINIEEIKTNKDHLSGLKKKETLDNVTDYYDLTNEILDKKSNFASSILYLALTKDIKWKTPNYIEEGFLWLAK